MAQRLGFDWDEALTLGRAVPGLNAYSKGVSLWLFVLTPEAVREARKKARPSPLTINLLHRAVPAVMTPGGVRALAKQKVFDSQSVERYLDGKFGEQLEPTRVAIESLGRSIPPNKLAEAAYRLYEEARPVIPGGVQGWGPSATSSLPRCRASPSVIAHQMGRFMERNSLDAY